MFFLRRAVSGDADEPARACEIAALESREMRPGERDGDAGGTLRFRHRAFFGRKTGVRRVDCTP